MSLLFVTAFSFVFVTSQIAAEGSSVVSYSGYQVWKIKPSSEEDRQFVSNVIDSYGKAKIQRELLWPSL